MNGETSREAQMSCPARTLLSSSSTSTSATGFRTATAFSSSIAVWLFNCTKSTKSYRFPRLAHQVLPQVSLVRRRHRMAGHDGMPVDPEDVRPEMRKQMSEGRIALQLRRADDQKGRSLIEDRRADIESAADASGFGTGIERRANLVMAKDGP